MLSIRRLPLTRCSHSWHWHHLAACSSAHRAFPNTADDLTPTLVSTHPPELAVKSDDRRVTSRSSLLKQYWKLSKGKLTIWVALSALPGYLLALPGSLDPTVLLSLASGTVLTSASAQALNQLHEIERDGRMHRTAQRPLPSGQMTPLDALQFAIASGSTGLCILSMGANPATAGIAAATIVTYVGIYTPMKVVSPYNTHIGAISGSLPTLLGFTAALGTSITCSPWAGHAAWLFTLQTLWQMPHFYALAWLHRNDYIRGGYSMFPLSDATGHATAKMSKPYLVVLCGMPFAASACGLASWMLPVGALVPTALWWQSLKNFEHRPGSKTCRNFFLNSLSSLLANLALFTAFARADHPRLLGQEDEQRNLQEAAETPLTQGQPERNSQESSKASEPMWRTSIHNMFSELCPHENFKKYFLGLFKSECPFGRQST